jgi:hypothetical protein
MTVQAQSKVFKEVSEEIFFANAGDNARRRPDRLSRIYTIGKGKLRIHFNYKISNHG